MATKKRGGKRKREEEQFSFPSLHYTPLSLPPRPLFKRPLATTSQNGNVMLEGHKVDPVCLTLKGNCKKMWCFTCKVAKRIPKHVRQMAEDASNASIELLAKRIVENGGRAFDRETVVLLERGHGKELDCLYRSILMGKVGEKKRKRDRSAELDITPSIDTVATLMYSHGDVAFPSVESLDIVAKHIEGWGKALLHLALEEMEVDGNGLLCYAHFLYLLALDEYLVKEIVAFIFAKKVIVEVKNAKIGEEGKVGKREDKEGKKEKGEEKATVSAFSGEILDSEGKDEDGEGGGGGECEGEGLPDVAMQDARTVPSSSGSGSDGTRESGGRSEGGGVVREGAEEAAPAADNTSTSVYHFDTSALLRSIQRQHWFHGKANAAHKVVALIVNHFSRGLPSALKVAAEREAMLSTEEFGYFQRKATTPVLSKRGSGAAADGSRVGAEEDGSTSSSGTRERASTSMYGTLCDLIACTNEEAKRLSPSGLRVLAFILRVQVKRIVQHALLLEEEQGCSRTEAIKPSSYREACEKCVRLLKVEKK